MTVSSILAPRVPLLDREQAPGEIATLYDQVRTELGMVPNMFKALANVPTLAEGFTALLRPLMAEGSLPRWYKELIATHVSSLNECEDCIATHRYLALKRGATPAQVASCDNFESGPFTAREKAGLRFAGLLHQSGHAVNEAAFAAVSAHFNTQEIVELAALAAAFELVSRFNSGLRIPVTPLPEAD
jgi:uncharacterized peroxidase-related enzyme